MAGEHVQEKVEGSSSPRSLQENASGIHNLREQRENAQHSRKVLKHHNVPQRIFRVDVSRKLTTRVRNHKPNHHLRDWQDGEKIDPKVKLEVSGSDGFRIRDKLTTAEEASGRLNERGPKAKEHVNDVKKVCQGAEDCHGDLQVSRDGDTAPSEVDLGEVEEERVDEDSNQAGS
jgi:hypothetical protein